jgi:hypothetical protein
MDWRYGSSGRAAAFQGKVLSSNPNPMGKKKTIVHLLCQPSLCRYTYGGRWKGLGVSLSGRALSKHSQVLVQSPARQKKKKQQKGLNRHFWKVQMANTKTIKKMQIKPTVRYRITPVTMATMKMSKQVLVGCREKRARVPCWGDVNWPGHYGKPHSSAPKNLKPIFSPTPHFWVCIQGK